MSELKTGQSVVSREDYEVLNAERDQVRRERNSYHINATVYRQQRDLARANCAEIMRRYKDVAIVNHSKSHSDQFDFVTCPAQTCREYREMEKDTPGQALLDRLKALERVRELPGKWRSSADGPVPTDRSIGYETCADELDEALAACQVIGQPLKRGQP